MTSKELSEKMRADWDRRIAHDYRFWMSDGYADDSAMWRSGERDYAIVLREITARNTKTFLELGCGVGRLLKPALADFGRVIGVDVSPLAIDKVRELLGPTPNLELVLGNGYDLSGVPTQSVDVALSFAAISTIPADVIAAYLRELHRVIKPDGVLRLQMYVGTPQGARARDTLHIRCFTADRLIRGLEAAGFSVEWIEELVLPFQVSFKEAGIEAKVLSVTRRDVVPAAKEAIRAELLPEGEADETNPQGSPLEYWMALNFAKELVKRGDLRRAEETVQYAVSQLTTTTIDVRDLLDRIINETKQEQPETPPIRGGSGILEKNLRVLQQRFPEAWELVRNCKPQAGIEFRETDEGPTLFENGQSLDHPSKPRKAAENWAKKLEIDPQTKAATAFVVLGFGGGYHAEALCLGPKRELWFIEPSVAAFRAALDRRDLSEVLTKIAGLHLGPSPIGAGFARDAELIVRPQSQVVYPEFCQQVRAAYLGGRGLRSLTPKIAVMGPLHGGTLPMLPYVTNALQSMRQRVNVIDVSEFNGAYLGLERMVRSVNRRGVLEKNFIELVSESVLQMAIERPFDVLITLAFAPISGRVLQELRKMGIITVHWFVEDHMRFTYWKQMAQHYDIVFTIQKGECIERMRAAGAGEVHYLPVACDPTVHRPLALSAEEKNRWGSPISFVGAGYNNRVQTFASMAQLPFKIWGTEWPGNKPFDLLVQESGRRLTPDEYVRIFNSTDVNINLHSSAERDGVDPYGDFLNPRVFELAAAGAFQLVDQRSLLSESFEPGREVATFNTSAELKERINYYLQHPEERKQIAARARDRVLREHTYIHRMQRMLETIYSSRYEQLKRRDVSNSWTKLLERSKPYEELHKRCQAAFARGDEPIIESLVNDVTAGAGKLSETEQKLMFLYHIQRQIISMKREDAVVDDAPVPDEKTVRT